VADELGFTSHLAASSGTRPVMPTEELANAHPGEAYRFLATYRNRQSEVNEALVAIELEIKDLRRKLKPGADVDQTEARERIELLQDTATELRARRETFKNLADVASRALTYHTNIAPQERRTDWGSPTS